MNKILNIEVTKVAEGNLQTMMSFAGTPVDVLMSMHEIIMQLNKCFDNSGQFNIKNSFWVMLSEHINEDLKEESKK